MAGAPLLDTARTAGGTLELLYALLDQLPVCVAVHDVGAGFPLRYANRAMGGAEPFARPEVREVAAKAAAAGEPRRLELELGGGDGERRALVTVAPLAGAGDHPLALVCMVEDLTPPVLARRRIESALDHGLHLLLEVARLAEERADVEDFLAGVSERLAPLVRADRVAFGRYDAERRALVPVGTGAGSATSLPCDPDAADLVSQVVFAGRVYRGRLDPTSLEFRPHTHLAHLWRADGTEVLMVPWRAGNERLGAVIAYGARQPEGFTDEHAIVLIGAGHAAGLVWQRKQAELKLAERARQLETLERAKSSFLLLASHELRTPLTLLNGYVSMLADGSAGSDRLTEILPIVEHAVRRMNVLVDQLMDAMRLGDGEIRLRLEPIDLRGAVGDAIGRVVQRWRRESDLEVVLPPHEVQVAVDVLRIETAVENLVDNAFKYSVAGNRVRCELVIEGDHARLVVLDEGIGMSDEETAGLFVAFGRMVNPLNSHIGGPGMGLFLSREIARLHGGEITVTSLPGEGSRFELSLPLGGQRP